MSIFKKMREGFEKRARGMHKEGMALTRANELLNELCDRLRQIGVNGTVHVSESMAETMGGMLVGGVAGYVAIEGRNIDLIQVETVSQGFGYITDDTDRMPYMLYNYHYVVLGNVTGLAGRLEAIVKPITKGFLSKKVVDFRWEGGDLAQRLNGDAELRTMMLREGLNQLPDIEVRAHGKPRRVPGIGKPPQAFLDAQAAFKPCVRITKRPKIPSFSELRQRSIGIGMQEPPRVGVELPTHKILELYDRIAHHIRSIMNLEKMSGEGE